ncbi:MAG: hypothetical protein ACR2M8_09060 [Pyrinomonadaceae bacterium]
MLNGTIAKFCAFVILTVGCAASTACNYMSSNDHSTRSFDQAKSPYETPKIVGKIESPEITESSGLAASRCRADVLWTHNDSGDGAYIFAMNSKGAHLGTWKVKNAENTDWEDIAAFKDGNGTCFLYICDIGNTNKLERTEHKIYRVLEPDVSAENKSSTRKSPLQTEAAQLMRFRYSDTPHDAETLMVEPKSGDIYVLTKGSREASAVYKLKPVFASEALLKADKLSDLALPAVPNGLLTGGSISPDGLRMILCDYSAGYEFTLPLGAGSFDDIWKQKSVVVNIGDRKQGEAISYSSDGNSVFATSEKKNAPIIEILRKN